MADLSKARAAEEVSAEFRREYPEEYAAAQRRHMVGTLSHIVSMIDHGNYKIARTAAIELLNEVRANV